MSKHSAYQIGIIRDYVNQSENSIYETVLDVIRSAKNIKESYNSPSSDTRFEDLSVSSAVSLSYAIWHNYNKVIQEKDSIKS